HLLKHTLVSLHLLKNKPIPLHRFCYYELIFAQRKREGSEDQDLSYQSSSHLNPSPASGLNHITDQTGQFSAPGHETRPLIVVRQFLPISFPPNLLQFFRL